MGKLHPLVNYFFVGLIFVTFLSYLVYYGFKRKVVFFLHHGLFNHAISGVLVVLAVITGLAQSANPYIQQKTTFIFLFPHKWLGILLMLYTLATFPLIWIKQKDLNWKLGILIAVVGLGLAISVVVFGWLLRLMFF
ncbi:MAG: hypothetical protein DSY42_00995 [Aquifex sp.]|nr:MAG: hypothetical protein DSY42_00995 [Aquifex sp.]